MPTPSQPLILILSAFLLFSLAVATPPHHRHHQRHPRRGHHPHHKHRQQQNQTAQRLAHYPTSHPPETNTMNPLPTMPPTIVKRTRTERRQFLYEHNVVRKQLNEPPLAWNKTLVWYARAFAKKRAGDCQMTHSLGPYGENIYWGSEYDRHSASDAVRAWAGEASDYDQGSNQCAQGKMCGHYTQIVWRDSVSVGCARVRCDNGGALVICSYDPPGNYVGESPFGVEPSGGNSNGTSAPTNS